MKTSLLKIAQAEILELMLNARVVTKNQLRSMAAQLREEAAVETIEEEVWGQIKFGKYTLIKNEYDDDVLQVLFDGGQKPVQEDALEELLDALFKEKGVSADKDMASIAQHVAMMKK